MNSSKNLKVIIIIISAILLISLVLFYKLNKETEENIFSGDDSENLDYDDNIEETATILTGITTEEIYKYTNYDYSDVDISDNREESEIQTINLNDEDSIVNINSSGTYVISGTLNEGQIIVSSEDEGEVKLILNGTNIISSTNSPILIESAKETIIILAEGTTNSITDNSEYVDPDTDETATPAAIYSKDDLYINGLGKLIINSENKNGIQSKDQLIIIDGDITITAKKEAIKAKDYLVIENGKFILNSGEDGISVTEDEDAEKGWIVINSGTIRINSQYDGISAKTYLLINDGELNITTSSTDKTISAKGIKADYYIEIDGGIININSADDGIHSNNEIKINKCSIKISSGDDGIHSDELIEINYGEINIAKSIEGIESKNIYINNGEISIISSDDGINVADSTMVSAPMEAAIDGALYISGGNLYVNANGDGLDSNGDMYITGGFIIVNSPTNNGNGGLDVNGECLVDGGFLVVASSSGMAESPDASSEQNSVSIFFTSTMPAGTLIHIESSSGKNILTFAPAKTFQAIVISSNELITGETYKIYIDGTASGTETNGLYETEDYNAGTLYQEFTISSTITILGTANSMNNNMDGGMQTNPRGMR
ncbi:MAG: carbohydrate-binding domain-containing protein [Flavobacterium sp.]|uniref:carbohydrate-binding domain-containing protein n=1 Tax=Flavobacterium sp. TaxID=239 RepID=UPI00261B6F45|nr:carbohydrate-binding domain-containing protein [Flavobacterium sp.]MDD5151368.1 carbohydrate-binding domain-containing protein [Flavobacterium sp.]